MIKFNKEIEADAELAPEKRGSRAKVSWLVDINERTNPLNTIRSNPEIVPLTKFENLSINDFMSRLLLLDGRLHTLI